MAISSGLLRSVFLESSPAHSVRMDAKGPDIEITRSSGAETRATPLLSLTLVSRRAPNLVAILSHFLSLSLLRLSSIVYLVVSLV